MSVYQEASAVGSDDPSYTLLHKNLPCNIVPVSGGEVYRGRQIEAGETHAIETRRYVNWLPTMRIYDQNREVYLNVQRSFEVDGRRNMIVVTASEVVL
jgi:hypothetical protein